MSSNLDFSLADIVFHLSEHFLENSAKLTEESGCFFLCSSRQVCTKKAYEDILPRGLLGSPFLMMLLLRRRLPVHLVEDFPRSSAQRPLLTATLLPWLRCELVPLWCLERRWFWACYYPNSHWFSRSNSHGVGDWKRRRGRDLTGLSWEYPAWQVAAGPSSWLSSSCLFHTWGSLPVGLQGLCFSLPILWAGRGCWKSFSWES